MPRMSVQQIKEWRSDTAMYDSAFAAMYYLRIKVDNPVATNGDADLLVPPSGHVAALVPCRRRARVHKAPANEVLRGVLEEMPITDKGWALNPDGINCIRPSVSGVGPHPELQHRVDLHQRSSSVQHDRDDISDGISLLCSSRTTGPVGP